MAASGADRSVHIARDASGNTIVTGDHNTIVVYQLRALAAEEDSSALAQLGDNPYRGLEAFDENDSARFFGRARETSVLWQKLHDLATAPPGPHFVGRILPIVGPSGCGKSSLARAGLIAELVRRPWPGRSPSTVAVLTPGERPLESLAAAILKVRTKDVSDIDAVRTTAQQLNTRAASAEFNGLRLLARSISDPSNSVVLLIDQFEEVFSLCSDAEERNAFVENLRLAALDATDALSIVLTLRSDFLSRTQRITWLSEAVTYNGYLVPKMDDAALRLAISEPARLAGSPIDTATVDLLMQQASGRDGALPLLEFSLSQIWQGLAQTPSLAPADTLRAIGGVGGALAREAQRQYDALSEQERAIAKRAFISGVHLSDTGRDTRRRYGIGDIVAGGQSVDDVLRVVRRFSGRDARLLTLSTSPNSEIEVEITHETLISAWPALAQWVTRRRDDILFHRRVADAADEWKSKTGGVWRTPELERLRALHEREAADFTQVELDFYEASERQQRRETRARRAGVLSLFVGVVVTSLLAVWAFRQRQQAKTESVLARAHELAAKSNAALSLYPQRSLLFAAAAEQLGANTVSPEQALHDALGRIAGRGLGTIGGHVREVAFAPDGRWLVANDQGGKVSIRSIPATSDESSASRFIGYGAEYAGLDLSADRRWLVTREGHSIRLLDLRTPDQTDPLLIPDAGLYAFTPNSRFLAVSSEKGPQIRLWSLEASTSHPAPRAVQLDIPVRNIVSSNVDVLVLLTDGAVCRIDLNATTSACQPVGLNLPTSSSRIWVSDDGGILLTEVDNGQVNWQGGQDLLAAKLATGVPVVTLLADVPRTEHLVLSHNAQWVAITTGTDLNTGNGGLIHLCDIRRAPADCSTLDEHRGNVSTLLFTKNDRALVSTGWDRTTRLWRLDDPGGQHSSTILRGHTAPVNTCALDPTGRWLATGADDETVIVWDMNATDVASTGRVFRGMEAPVSSISFSLTGSHLAAGADDGGLRVWPLAGLLHSADPDTVQVQLGHSDVGTGMTFSPDMRWAFTYEGEDGSVFILRRAEPARRADDPIVLPYKLEQRMLDAAFSPDSRWLAISDANVGAAKLYQLSGGDPRSHEVDVVGSFPEFRNHAVFSPDGNWLQTVTDDDDTRQIHLWDLTSAPPHRHDLPKGRNVATTPLFSPNGAWFAYALDDSLRIANLKASSPDSDIRVVGETPSGFSAIWFTPDNRALAYFSNASHALVTYDLDRMTTHTSGTALGDEAAVNVSPDRTWLLTSVLDSHGAAMWSSPTSKTTSIRLWSYSGDQYTSRSDAMTLNGELRDVKFSKDSRWLIMGSDQDTNPTLWDLRSSDPSRQRVQLWGHTVRDNHYWREAFSHDGRWLATASYDDENVRLWDLSSRNVAQAVTVLWGRKTTVGDFDFAPDNKSLVAIDSKGARIWRITPNGVSDISVALGDTLSDERSGAEGMAFSQTADELVTWGGRAANFWSLSLPELMRKARQASGRNFSWDEWVHAYPGQEYMKLFPELPVDRSVVSGILEQAHLTLLRGDKSNATRVYQTAASWAEELHDPVVSNQVAWNGATDNMAPIVRAAAEFAVRVQPANGNYRDTRGLIRALTGEVTGAIEDYEAYLQWASALRYPPRADIDQRRSWVEALKAGKSPFSSTQLESLHND